MSEGAVKHEDGTPDFSTLSDVANVLVLAPSLGAQGREACLKLFSQRPPGDINLLTITYTDTAAEQVNQWQTHVGGSPVRAGIVTVGQAETTVDDPAWAVKAVENPTDLTGVGIEFNQLLSKMVTAAEEHEDIILFFDSVTSLLQYAELQRAFRFLHVVTSRMKTANGVGYYRLDPDAHDGRTIATLKGLFDAVAEVDEDGNWTIQH